MMTKVTTMTPNALAAKLGGPATAEKIGKTFVRPLLRRYFPRSNDAKGTSWYMTDVQIALVTNAWKAKQRGERYDAEAFLKSRRTRKPKAKATETPAT